MSKRLFPFRPAFKGHLSDAYLTWLVCDELSMIQKFFVRRHLANCWQCRARYERMEKAALGVVAYRDAHLKPHLPLSDGKKQEFAREMALLFAEKAPQRSWAARISGMTRSALPDMDLTLTAGIVFALASVLCVTFWLQQRTPNISSNALLVRAEAWDAPHAGNSSGVIYQKVSITTAKDKVERTIYRDVEGRRKPRAIKLAVHEDRIRLRLQDAGLNWDAPLFASGYQDWHDRQRVREDRISRAGRHLIRLTTTIPSGTVAEQSLTVRDTDFHPVQRTVALRNSETIEIAEVDYAVLPWTSVSPDTFEPLGKEPALAVATGMPSAHLSLPPVVTAGQLDEAELAVRLVLNQLHADTDEQMQVERDTQSIEVKGLVETEKRRRELQAQLRIVPHTTVSILSIEDLKSRPDSETEITSVKMASVSAQPSPLQIYFAANGRSVDAVSGLSHRLLNSALTVNRESKALDELQSRFSPGESKLTNLAAATFTELIFSHREKLLQALQEEQSLLAEAGFAGSGTRPEVPQEALTMGAERNLALCKELTLGNGTSSRSADAILLELSGSVNELRAGARQTRIHSPNNALDGRK